MTFLKPKTFNRIKQGFAFAFLGLSISITMLVLIFILFYIFVNGLYTVKEKDRSAIALENPSLVWYKGEYTIWGNPAVKQDSLTFKELQDIFTSSVRNWGYLTEQNFPLVPILLTRPDAEEEDKALWLDYLSPRADKNFQNRVKISHNLEEALSMVRENKGAVLIIRERFLSQKDRIAISDDTSLIRMAYEPYIFAVNLGTDESQEEFHLNLSQIKELRNQPSIMVNGTEIKADSMAQDLIAQDFEPDLFQATTIHRARTEQEVLRSKQGVVAVVSDRWAQSSGMTKLVWKEEYRSFSLTRDYFTTAPFEGSKFGGISFIIGNTLLMIAGTSLLAIPLGVSSALYLTHYSHKKSKLSGLIRSAFDVLSSLPAIIFGLFGMTVFVPIFGLGLISGCLSTMLMILPNITKASEEAIKAVPKELYHASLALGATKFTSLFRVVIPSAVTGIITGIILAIGRAFSEAAVLLFTLGTSLTQIGNLHTSGRVLTVHLYLILQEGGLAKAFPVAVVIVITVLILNIIADTIRDRLGRRLKSSH